MPPTPIVSYDSMGVVSVECVLVSFPYVVVILGVIIVCLVGCDRLYRILCRNAVSLCDVIPSFGYLLCHNPL